jgi:uncharacterized protein YjbI with pentapeptide repeats
MIIIKSVTGNEALINKDLADSKINRGIIFHNYFMNNSKPMIPGFILEDMSLHCKSFKKYEDGYPVGILFYKCILKRVTACRANFNFAIFQDCIIKDCSFNKSRFKNAQFLGKCVIENCEFLKSNFSKVSFSDTTRLFNCDLTGANIEKTPKRWLLECRYDI